MFFYYRTANLCFLSSYATICSQIVYKFNQNLISQRTKEALARRRAEGVILGRPVGCKSAKTKLSGQEKTIQELLDKKVSYSAIGRILGVHQLTVSSFVANQKLCG